MFYATCRDEEFRIEMREAITGQLPPYLASIIQQADADARRADEEAAQQEEETVAPGFAATVAGEAAAAPGSGAVQGLSMPLTLIGRLLEEITPGSGASATSACTSDCSTSAASRLPPSQ
ncbi:MAG: hypothetical protein ABWY05_17135 [Noviherbaspirillum sp.]